MKKWTKREKDWEKEAEENEETEEDCKDVFLAFDQSLPTSTLYPKIMLFTLPL